MDMLMDKSMLDYDKLMQEKYQSGEAKRFLESRKRRMELEAIDQSLRAQQEKAQQEIRLKEVEEAR
jgi:hypothetical protein